MAALDPVMTIGSQIVDTIRRHQPGVDRRAARRRAVELLREVEVPAAERRLGDYPHQYSGGMRQRVMIAIALANDPDIVIADEPTTALDVTTQAQVLDLLDRLVGERGAAIVLITHNLGSGRGVLRPRPGHVCRPHRRAGGRRRHLCPATAPLHGGPAAAPFRAPPASAGSGCPRFPAFRPILALCPRAARSSRAAPSGAAGRRASRGRRHPSSSGAAPERSWPNAIWRPSASNGWTPEAVRSDGERHRRRPVPSGPHLPCP